MCHRKTALPASFPKLDHGKIVEGMRTRPGSWYFMITDLLCRVSVPPPSDVEGEREASGQEGHLKFPFGHTNLTGSGPPVGGRQERFNVTMGFHQDEMISRENLSKARKAFV